MPVPSWVKTGVDVWLAAAEVSAGPVFRAINKAGRIGANAFSPKVIWGVVKTACSKCGLDRVAPHDLSRACDRLCHQAGGELERIQFLPGHVTSTRRSATLVATSESGTLSTIASAWSQSNNELNPTTPGALGLCRLRGTAGTIIGRRKQHPQCRNQEYAEASACD